MSQRKTLGSLLVRLGMTDREADRAIKDFERKLKKLESNVKATSQAMTIGFTAPFIAGIAKAIQAYDEEIQVTRKLQIALGGTSQALQEQAAQIQRTTKFADDEIITQQAWAAALGHTEGQILDMTEAAVGLAAGLGMGLDEAMKALHQTTMGQSKTLGKLIPEIKEMTKEQLKSGAAIDLVRQKFQGYAEAAAITGAGPLTVLKNSFGDLAEQIGEVALPIIVSMADKLRSLISTFQSLDPEVKRAAVGFGAVVAAIGPLLIMLPKIIRLLAALLTPVSLTVAALAALAAAAIYIGYNWQKFTEDWKLIWWEIKNIAVGVINDVIGAMNLLSKAVNPYQLITGKDAFAYAEAPSTKGLNIGNDARAQMYARGSQYKSFGTVMTELGNDIWGFIGGAAGQDKIDAANKTLDELATSLGGVADKGSGAADALRGVVGSVTRIGGRPMAGSLSPSGGGAGRTDPVDAMKLIGTDMTGAIEAQTAGLDAYKQTWSTVADAVGGALQGIAKDMQEGMSLFAAFGKAALLSAAQVARAALVQVAANAMAAESKKGLAGILIGAAAGIAGISILEGLISNIKAPKLAKGGLAFGPTMAMVGDNPNAHVDPEVISPLSKLKGMLSGGGSQKVDVTVHGQIAGDVIRLSAARSQNRAIRRGSANVIRNSNLVVY